MAANSSHSPSLENEKLPHDAPKDAPADSKPKSRGFFSRKEKKQSPPPADEEKPADATVLDGAGPTPAKKIEPVSVAALFRYALYAYSRYMLPVCHLLPTVGLIHIYIQVFHPV